MRSVIQTFAIVKPLSGPNGLAIPHVDQGEIFEAFWVPGQGLKLRTANETVWIDVSDDQMEKNWKDDQVLQILETDAGKADLAWEVPLVRVPKL